MKKQSTHANAQLTGRGATFITTEMAVFTLETDYSCETGYPFDDSRQIGKYVLIWKWSSFNFEWTIRVTLSFNFDGQFEDGIIRFR